MRGCNAMKPAFTIHSKVVSLKLGSLSAAYRALDSMQKFLPEIVGFHGWRLLPLHT